jgi:hypothetical protein
VTDGTERVPTPAEVAAELAAEVAAPAGALPAPTDPPEPVVVVVDQLGAAVPTAAALSPEEVVTAAVLAVPGVLRMHGGRFGELGTYLPGRRVIGVRIDDAGTEVHVVVSDVAPVHETAARVQRAVSAIAPMPIHVHVEDIDTIV